MGGALTGLPKLTITPEYKKPLQGRGKPDKIMRNGRPGQASLETQLLGSGGGMHTKVITKAFVRPKTPRIGTRLGGAKTGPGAKSYRKGGWAKNVMGDNHTGELVSQKFGFQSIVDNINGDKGFVRRRPVGEGKFGGEVIARRNDGAGPHFGDGKVRKAFTREQKKQVAGSAALGAGITAAINPGTLKRVGIYGSSSARLAVAGARTKDAAGKAQYAVDAKRMGGIAGRNAKTLVKPALVWGGASAGLAAGQIALRNRKTKQAVSKMSDVELRRRKKLQGKIAITTSTAGLGSLGLLGAGAALKKPKLTRIASTGSIVTGGIGGAGGYNYAAISNAESKRRPIAKAFSAERNRHARSKAARNTSAGVGVAGLGAAGYAGKRTLDSHRELKTQRKGDANWLSSRSVKQTSELQYPGGGHVTERIGGKPVQGPPRLVETFGASAADKGKVTGSLNRLKKVRGKNLKATGGLAALGIGGLVAADRINSYSRGKGQTYRPRIKRPE